MRVTRAADDTPLLPDVLSSEHRFLLRRAKINLHVSTLYNVESTIFGIKFKNSRDCAIFPLCAVLEQRYRTNCAGKGDYVPSVETRCA